MQTYHAHARLMQKILFPRPHGKETLTCKHNKNANPRFQQIRGNPLLAHGLGTSVCKDQYAKMDCL